MSSFAELAKSRYSVRAFADTPVEQEKLDILLETARIAPTAANKQPQRVKVITSAEELGKIDAITPCRYGAPLVFLIGYDSITSWKSPFDGSNGGQIDASIVTTHLTLQAADLGLGSTWVGYYDPDKSRELFDLPEGFVLTAYLVVGYPASDAKPSDDHFASKELSEILF
jgi:nitroreductase